MKNKRILKPSLYIYNDLYTVITYAHLNYHCNKINNM